MCPPPGVLDGLQEVLCNDAGRNEQGPGTQVCRTEQREEGDHSLPGIVVDIETNLVSKILRAVQVPTLLARVARKLPKCKALSMRRLGRKPFILIDQVGPMILLPHSYMFLFTQHCLKIIHKTLEQFSFRMQSEMRLPSLYRTSNQQGFNNNNKECLEDLTMIHAG